DVVRNGRTGGSERRPDRRVDCVVTSDPGAWEPHAVALHRKPDRHAELFLLGLDRRLPDACPVLASNAHARVGRVVDRVAADGVFELLGLWIDILDAIVEPSSRWVVPLALLFDQVDPGLVVARWGAEEPNLRIPHCRLGWHQRLHEVGTKYLCLVHD